MDFSCGIWAEFVQVAKVQLLQKGGHPPCMRKAFIEVPELAAEVAIDLTAGHGRLEVLRSLTELRCDEETDHVFLTNEDDLDWFAKRSNVKCPACSLGILHEAEDEIDRRSDGW